MEGMMVQRDRHENPRNSDNKHHATDPSSTGWIFLVRTRNWVIPIREVRSMSLVEVLKIWDRDDERIESYVEFTEMVQKPPRWMMVRNGENKGIWMLDNLDMTHQALKQTRMLEIVGYDSPTIEQRELNETKQELRIENARKREANFVQV